MSLKALERWRVAGLISDDQAAAIRDFEAAHARPWGLWALAGIGGFAVALGFVALVAANWAALPDGVKLGGHGLLNLAAAAGVVRALRHGPAWLAELALFVFGALILTGLALIGQVFQLTSPLWRPLAIWALLCAPLFLLFGQGKLTALGWGLTLAGAALAFALDFEERWLWLPLLVVPLLIALGEASWASGGRAPFWAALRWLGLATALGGASALSVIWLGSPIGQENSRADLWRGLLVAGLASAALVAWLHQRGAAPLTAHLLSACLVVAALAMLAIPVPDVAGSVLAAAAFIGLWAAVAWAAQRHARSGLFRLAVALIVARLFLVYLEVFGSLATTGAGLILSGLLLIGAAFGTHRFLKANPVAP
jgi:hypothetical protein